MILLIFPFQAELDAFLPASPDRRETRLGGIRVFGSVSEPDLRLAVCGQGKVEAALACQILADASQPAAVLLIGSATALDPALRIGDIVVADVCIEYDFGADPVPRFKARAFPDTAGPAAAFRDTSSDSAKVVIGPMLSGDRNVFDPEQKRSLHERYAAKALAWEGAGFHRFLRRSGMAGWEIRVITETADSGPPTLAELQERMRRDFPGLRKKIQSLVSPAV